MGFFGKKSALDADGTSLQSVMRRFSALESSQKGSLAAYRTALGCLERNAPAIATPIRDSFRKELRALATAVGIIPEQREWDELSKNLEGSVKRYSKDLEAFVRTHENDAKQVLAMMSVLAESMAARESSYSVRFRDIAKKTRLLVTTQDIAVIRQRLSEEMTQLEKYAEDMDRDTHQAVARLKEDVRTTRERNDSAWDSAPLDPVTGLPGKAMGAGGLETFMGLQNRFGSVMFTIAGFDEIERKHGAKVGVELLGQFAMRLRNAFHTPEFLCRWGQARFLLLSPDDLVRLTTRATNLAHLLSTPYSTGSEVSITVFCHFNVVERRRDETGEQLIARLENA